MTEEVEFGRSKIICFRDLRVWQAGMNLAEHAYLVTGCFPRSELYALASQIQRSAVSIPSNIAEGHTRESRKEYLHHISIAQASLAELETQLEIAGRLKYVTPDHLNKLFSATHSLGKQLYALRNSLIKKSPGPRPPIPGP